MNKITGRGPYTGEWFDSRNERRKQRYHTDPKYRKEQNKSARDGYRKVASAAEPVDPRTNQVMLDPGPDCVGRLRTLEHMQEAGPVLTFTKGELAKVFERPTKQLQQWSADGRIPSPIIRARQNGVERTWTEVYTAAEAKAIVGALGPWLADLIYFRLDHNEAIGACRVAVTNVRKKTIVRKS